MKTRQASKKPTSVYVIAGPTCTGKTSLAIKLCQKYSGEIISADSRQIYKYMDIGTGKMPVNTAGTAGKTIKKYDGIWSIDGVSIRGYDLIEPDKYYSSYDFGLFALEKARKIISEGKKVFLTGGTGFYIDTFTKRIKPSFVEPDFEVREELSKLTTDDLAQKLKNLDFKSYQKIDLKNPARLIRAIEKSLAEQRRKLNELSGAPTDGADPMNKSLPYLENVRFIYLGLTAPRNILYEKADKWVDSIWSLGLIDETKELITNGYKNSPKLHGLIYKTVLDFLENRISEKNALERIKFDMHSYIRRQQTYFKKNPEIVWFDISRESFKENIYNFVNGQAD